jgi:hypothetical protein
MAALLMDEPKTSRFLPGAGPGMSAIDATNRACLCYAFHDLGAYRSAGRTVKRSAWLHTPREKRH